MRFFAVSGTDADVPGAQRVGWGLVAFNPDTRERTAAVHGTVPAPIPLQLPFVAETVVFLWASVLLILSEDHEDEGFCTGTVPAPFCCNKLKTISIQKTNNPAIRNSIAFDGEKDCKKSTEGR